MNYNIEREIGDTGDDLSTKNDDDNLYDIEYENYHKFGYHCMIWSGLALLV